MKIKVIDDNYYLISSEGMDMKRILKTVCGNTGMRKNSFADKQVRRIFSDLFGCAMDLKSDYMKYYRDEYDSFREFLYQKETMDYEVIDSMELQQYDTLWKLRFEINSYGVRDIIGYENENIPLFNRFLEGIRI